MKTNATIQTERRAQEQSEQVFKAQGAEFNKYLVLRFNHREQVTVFPFAMKHADVFGYMRRECPELEAISAGFFIVEGGEVWVTGNSESLNLAHARKTARPSKRFWKAPTVSFGI
jgi:hypothetical protein